MNIVEVYISLSLTWRSHRNTLDHRNDGAAVKSSNVLMLAELSHPAPVFGGITHLLAHPDVKPKTKDFSTLFATLLVSIPRCCQNYCYTSESHFRKTNDALHRLGGPPLLFYGFIQLLAAKSNRVGNHVTVGL